VEGSEHLHGHRAGERLEQLAQDKADVEAFASAATIPMARCRADQAKWERDCRPDVLIGPLADVEPEMSVVLLMSSRFMIEY
jgi:hypothetical protein